MSLGTRTQEVIWHELECGSYAEDLPLWRQLAKDTPGTVLDVGAGSGRVALDLARRGHSVIALDHDQELLAELERRVGAERLDVVTLHADARGFAAPAPVGLCLVPMQTIQLLGGADGRRRFLACAGSTLEPGALMAIAITRELELELYDCGATPQLPAPLPDICEREGIVYSSQPTAIRLTRDAFVLERTREVVFADGRRESTASVVELDRVRAEQIQAEALAVGLRPGERLSIAATAQYAGSEVVILRA